MQPTIQAAARCNLQPPTGSGEVSTDLPHSASDRLTQLACSRLLAATCVKQQIQAITDLQQQSCQPAAGGTDSKHGKHSLDSNLLEHSSQSSQGSESEALIQDGRASDVQAAAQEDKQLAEHAIARLLSSRQAGFVACILLTVIHQQQPVVCKQDLAGPGNHQAD